MTTCRFSEPNTGCGKSIVKSSLKPSNGLEARPLVAVAHLDRRDDAQVALGRVLLDDARRLQQEDERPGAAVHDRDLGPGDVDVQVVDAEAGERRHEVLDGRDRWRRRASASTTAACRRRVGASRGNGRPAARRSMRWNTMPVSARRRAQRRARPARRCAGPTPVVLIVVLSVRCFSMACVPSEPALACRGGAADGSKRIVALAQRVSVEFYHVSRPARDGGPPTAAGSAPAPAVAPTRADAPCPVSRPACAGTPGSPTRRTPAPRRPAALAPAGSPPAGRGRRS